MKIRSAAIDIINGDLCISVHQCVENLPHIHRGIIAIDGNFDYIRIPKTKYEKKHFYSYSFAFNFLFSTSTNYPGKIRVSEKY